ncbi:AAA family ATPase [Faecalicatena sp. AGMB00832]|uniref:AAA family ATPase n=1 Tax=Faecalicatena faecalis TaxID=2726362 RepID=A0ABS6D9Q2_9FIRM|nr:AAA family ATPase [Faecalicatena faecalis]MBU3878343.1 AAA family ATPase [Faecalicatena faecalis]
MADHVIHIYGGSGSGTTTLAKYISEKAGYFLMDTDHYYWLPADIPYTLKRSIPERLELMKKDIVEHDKVVISGSLVGWGDELIPFFTLAIRLVTDTDVRIARLRKREREHFGSRIDPSGDMYKNYLEFIEWASAYDTGGVEMRSKAMHDEWQKLLKCRQITLDGNNSKEYNFNVIIKESIRI